MHDSTVAGVALASRGVFFAHPSSKRSLKRLRRMAALLCAWPLFQAFACSSSPIREFGAVGGASTGAPSAGAASAGARVAGSAVTGASGAASEAGEGAASEAGEGGSSELSGAAGEMVSAGSTGAGGACTPVAWFPDGDGDGFGRSSAQVSTCPAPTSGKWVAKGGDCNDDDPSVFPQQSDYKSSGYAVSGGVSFDYDCSGQEQPDPAQQGAPACGSLLVVNCAGSGFANTNRTGAGVNPLCGSKTFVTCSAKDALLCEGLSMQVAEGVRCR